MEVRLGGEPIAGRACRRHMPSSYQLVDGQLVMLVAAAAEAIDLRQVDRQIIAFERQGPRRGKLRRLLDQPAVAQPEQ